MRQSKIQLDLTVGSRSQLLYHIRLGFWSQLLSRGFLNVLTLWSTFQSCCIYFLPFLSLERAILHLFSFFFLAFILTRELRPGNIQYWHHHRPWYGQLKRTLRSPLMIGATANMQKHNWYTNGQNIIKVYNALAFITNGSKIINISNYSQTEGQRPIKRNKES